MENHFNSITTEIITVGTELLLGQIIDTNSAYLSNKLAEIGINVYFKTSVGDNDERLIEALRVATARADVIVITGGLGPTVDDITKGTITKDVRLRAQFYNSRKRSWRLSSVLQEVHHRYVHVRMDRTNDQTYNRARTETIRTSKTGHRTHVIGSVRDPSTKNCERGHVERSQ